MQTIELRKSELLAVYPYKPFQSMNPAMQKNIAVAVLTKRDNEGANFVADQILRGNPNFEFVVADDITT